MTRLDAALGLAQQGFAVFPIRDGAKAPPLVSDWPKEATHAEGVVRRWWTQAPNANIGIHCRDLVVVDVDTKKGGDMSLAKLDLVHGLPETLTARTPSGGRHLFFRLPEGHAPVANGVDVLGQGLDVRSNHGYVVAAGSATPAGAYQWTDPAVPIAEAPAWLLEMLPAAGAPAERTAPEAVPDAPDDTMERALTWLRTAPVAIEGEAGDRQTYVVACRLRDFGLSAEQALEAMAGEWNSRCVPPWEADALREKVYNAFVYAQNEAGNAAPVAAADFPAMPPPEDSQTPVRAARGLQTAQELAASARRDSGYLVKGLLQRASHAVEYGAPGQGKSFVTMDLAYSVAAGRPWMDRKVHQGPVLYLAYEGVGGLAKRAQALLRKYGDKEVPFYVYPADFNLREREGRAALGAVLGQLPAKPVLIVIDTLARALKGGDENSAQDIGALNDAIGALIEATGACVLLIHHSGKNKQAGARGSSALLGAIDTELEVDEHQVIARKQREVELGDPIGFKLHPVVVGIDEDGDEVTSCYVDPAEAIALTPTGRIAGNAKRAFDVLCRLHPDNTPCGEQEWRDACKEFLPERDLRKRFYDVKTSLVQKGYVVIDNNGMVTRRME